MSWKHRQRTDTLLQLLDIFVLVLVDVAVKDRYGLEWAKRGFFWNYASISIQFILIFHLNTKMVFNCVAFQASFCENTEMEPMQNWCKRAIV